MWINAVGSESEEEAHGRAFDLGMYVITFPEVQFLYV